MKKAPKKKAKAYTGPTILDKLPKDHGEWLELCVKFTERAVKSHGQHQFLIDQVERLKQKLADWRKNENKNQKTSS